jgi:hypothetical protein
MLAKPDFSSDVPVSMLLQIGSTCLEAARSPLRGDVLGPAGPIVTGSTCTALYVTAPNYFDDDFAVYSGDADPVVVMWLIPITESEARLVSVDGWPVLEERFVTNNPDVLDFFRPSCA